MTSAVIQKTCHVLLCVDARLSQKERKQKSLTYMQCRHFCSMQSHRESCELIPPNLVVTQQWIVSKIKTTKNAKSWQIHLPPDPTVAIILLQLRLHDSSFDMALYDQMIIAGRPLSLREGQFAILDDAKIRDYVVASKYEIVIHLVPAETRCEHTHIGGISGLV